MARYQPQFICEAKNVSHRWASLNVYTIGENRSYRKAANLCLVAYRGEILLLNLFVQSINSMIANAELETTSQMHRYFLISKTSVTM
jgi:hypothetical protein